MGFRHGYFLTVTGKYSQYDDTSTTILCVPVTAPLTLVAVAVMTCMPGVAQVKVAVSVRPFVWVRGDCPVACHS